MKINEIKTRIASARRDLENLAIDESHPSFQVYDAVLGAVVEQLENAEHILFKDLEEKEREEDWPMKFAGLDKLITFHNGNRFVGLRRRYR